MLMEIITEKHRILICTPKVRHFWRCISKEVGITFSEYLKNTRIKHAIFLIEQGITSVKNIAILSGYRDPLYFSKIFQQTVGISPSIFINKKHHKNEHPEQLTT